MAQVTFKGNPINLVGDLPQENATAEDVILVKDDMSEVKLSEMKGKVKILIVVPSLDTSVCATETRNFSQKLSSKKDIEAIVISKDLPFAMKRYMQENDISNITSASDFRYCDFNKKFNTEMADGPLKGLSARAVFVLDKDNVVKYAELVPEIAQEPDYDKAIEAAEKLV
ncbi:MAG: thiol peroxidase [Candidatus Cyclobacteriaceae bacterium M3_2C_046]